MLSDVPDTEAMHKGSRSMDIHPFMRLAEFLIGQVAAIPAYQEKHQHPDDSSNQSALNAILLELSATIK